MAEKSLASNAPFAGAAPGKGVVPANTKAQAGTAGGIAASGAGAAAAAQQAGLRPWMIAAIVVVTAAVAIGGAFYLRFSNRIQQEA